MFPHGVSSGSNSPLSGFVEGFLNGVFIDPAKIGPELLKVNGLRGDSMFVLSKFGDEVTEFRQPLQVQSHLEMQRILAQLGHIQCT